MSAFEVGWSVIKAPFFETEPSLYEYDPAPGTEGVPAADVEQSYPGLLSGASKPPAEHNWDIGWFDDRLRYSPIAEREIREAAKRMNADPRGMIEVYRAIPSNIGQFDPDEDDPDAWEEMFGEGYAEGRMQEPRINPGDWVTPSYELAVGHGEDEIAPSGRDYDILSAMVNIYDLYSRDMNSTLPGEYGWVGRRDIDDPEVRGLLASLENRRRDRD